jgi:hypothetical protein
MDGAPAGSLRDQHLGEAASAATEHAMIGLRTILAD